MTIPLTIEADFYFRRHGPRQVLHASPAPPPQPFAGRVPRVARLMALAIRFDQLLHDGVVTDYAELARLGHVTRARITQIMNLRMLAPDIQEAILFLPRVEQGDDPLILRDLLPITMVADWRKQRELFTHLR